MSVVITECPRDAMQGIVEFIPTELKIKYINSLLKVGFQVLDFGSFVSPKVIPQLQDTAQVLEKLEWERSKTALLSIVANVRGAETACQFEQIHYIGFPLSVSETFQQRNTNKSIAQGLEEVEKIQELCEKHQKKQVVYLSMGFGNPYNEPYSPEIVGSLTEKLALMGVKNIALSDTIGASTPDNIQHLFKSLSPAYPTIEFGVHLHSTPQTALEKISAAYEAGCRRFDGALKGYGGCPMADDELTGNIATELILNYLSQKKIGLTIDQQAFEEAMILSERVFH